eukprot:jgi/Tetstr1/424561/TSEL_015087.t1
MKKKPRFHLIAAPRTPSGSTFSYREAGEGQELPRAREYFQDEGKDSQELHGFVDKQLQTRAGGIIKHNTKAVKNLAPKQAFPGDNVDEGSGPEPSTKKAKQPAKPAAGVPARDRDDERMTDEEPYSGAELDDLVEGEDYMDADG